MGFSKQECWSGLPCPPPEDLPDSDIELMFLSLLHCQADSLPLLLRWPCVPSQAPRTDRQWLGGENNGITGASALYVCSRTNTYAGEGNGNPLQYSCQKNCTDRGAWWATVHGVAKSQARLSDFTFTFKVIKYLLSLNSRKGGRK